MSTSVQFNKDRRQRASYGLWIMENHIRLFGIFDIVIYLKTDVEKKSTEKKFHSIDLFYLLGELKSQHYYQK